MITRYDEQQLDALRELASIGSGTAATALAGMLGRSVELAVPRALALPLADALDAVEIRTVRGAPLLPLGGELLPLLDGAEALAIGLSPSGQRTVDVTTRGYAVIVSAAGRRVALAVSALAGQRELVTRRLPRTVSQRAAAAGGAVLPDGGIALVVDCDALTSERRNPSPGQPEGVPA